MFPVSTKRALFRQRSRKARQKKKAPISDFSSADTLTEEPQRLNSGPWQFCLKGSEDSQLLVSKSNIKQIAKKETAYSRLFIKLCTVFQTLQKVDPLLQQKRLYLAKTKLVERSVDRAPVSVLATIVEKTTDPILDPP